MFKLKTFIIYFLNLNEMHLQNIMQGNMVMKEAESYKYKKFYYFSLNAVES